MVAHQEVEECRISLFSFCIIWASSVLVNSSSSISFKLELLIVFPLRMLSFDGFFLMAAFSSAIVGGLVSDLNVRTLWVHFLNLCASVLFLVSHSFLTGAFSFLIARIFFRLTLLSRLKFDVVVCWLHEKFTVSYDGVSLTTDGHEWSIITNADMSSALQAKFLTSSMFRFALNGIISLVFCDAMKWFRLSVVIRAVSMAPNFNVNAL